MPLFRFVNAAIVLSLTLAAPAVFADVLNFSSGLTVETTWISGPVTGGESRLRLQFRETANGQPTTPEESIRVELWMPSMGHGSRQTQVVAITDAAGTVMPGAYEVRQVYFIMGGDWEVRVHLTAANGQCETQSFQLMLPGGHGHH